MSDLRIERFFTLSALVSESAFRGKFLDDKPGLPLLRGDPGAKHEEPFTVTWAMGGAEPGDVIWTTSAHPLILHDRVVQLWKSQRFTGWRTYPVIVLSKDGEPRSGYHGISIHGRCGHVDLERSKVVLREMPGRWSPYFREHHFKEDFWDGSDVFMESPDARGEISSRRFITERVQASLVAAGTGNLKLVRLNEVERSTSNYSIGKKHLLPEDFEHRVAAAYAAAGVPQPPPPDKKNWPRDIPRLR